MAPVQAVYYRFGLELDLRDLFKDHNDAFLVFATLLYFASVILAYDLLGSRSLLYRLWSKSYDKMAQIRGTAGYNLGGSVQDRFGGPSRSDATNDPSPLDAIREQTSRIEDWLDTYSDPIKP